jgi:acyl carrier protein
MKSYVNEVINAIRQVMDIDDSHVISEDTFLVEDLGFDSGLYLDLNLMLEETVEGLRMDPSRMQSEDFRTVRTIAAHVGKCMSEAEKALA